MATNLDELTAAALKLPPESRARPADLLVESLDAGALGRLDRSWIAEAKRRRDELRSGLVKAVPAATVARSVRDAARVRR